MKKLMIALLCFLSIFMVACSNSTPTPGEQENVAKENRNMFTMDAKGLKSIATSNVSIRNGLTRGADQKTPDTILVYWDENDNLAPLVFKNKDGKHVMFAVSQSYSLDDSTFAIDFSEMMVSPKPPVFMVKDTRDGSTEKIPVVEKIPEMLTYHFDGQLIISIKDGKASFLTAVNLADFSGGTDLYSSSYRPSYIFDLRSAFVHDGYVYLTTKNAGNSLLYKISLTKPTEAVPLSNIENFSVDYVVSASKDGILVDGRSGYNEGRYLMSLDGKVWPEKVSDAGFKIDHDTTDGYGFVLEDVGSFNGNKEILLDSAWWHLNSSNSVRNFYKLASTGEDFMHPLANGFTYAGKEVKKDWIEKITPDRIIFNGQELEIKVRAGETDANLNGTLYTTAREDNPITSNGVQLKDYRKILEKGFYVDGKLIKANRISWNYYDYNNTRYHISTDNDGYICVAEKKCYPEINGKRVADVSRLGGNKFTLDGNEYNPLDGDHVAYSDRNVVINGKSYKLERDKPTNFIYLMMPNDNPVHILDQYNQKISDDRLKLIGPISAGKLGNLTGVEYKLDPMRLVCDDGKEYYMNSEASEFLSISYDCEVPFMDASGNRINGVAKTIATQELKYYDGTPVVLAGYGENYIHPENSTQDLTLEIADDGKLYTTDSNSNVFIAAEIAVGKDLKVSPGRTLSLRIDDMTGSTENWVLMNVLKAGAGQFVLYYYQESSTEVGNQIYKIGLDLNNEGKMELLGSVSLGSQKLPRYEYTTNRNRFWSENYTNIVFTDNGHKICWLEPQTNTLYTCNMDDGAVEQRVFDTKFGGSLLSKLGNNLVFSLAPSGTRVNTYLLNTRNVMAEPKLISTSDMAVIPLWDLNAAEL